MGVRVATRIWAHPCWGAAERITLITSYVDLVWSTRKGGGSLRCCCLESVRRLCPWLLIPLGLRLNVYDCCAHAPGYSNKKVGEGRVRMGDGEGWGESGQVYCGAPKPWGIYGGDVTGPFYVCGMAAAAGREGGGNVEAPLRYWSASSLLCPCTCRLLGRHVPGRLLVLGG